MNPEAVIPQDDFQTNMFAWVIREQLKGWAEFGLRGSLGEYQDDGTWTLTVEQAGEITWSALFPPHVTGKVWIESGMTPIPRVCWSIPATEHGPAEYGSLGDAPHLWLS